MRPSFTALASLGCLLILSACSTLPAPTTLDAPQWLQQLHSPAAPPPALLLLGEQHDAPEHQQWQHATVQTLIVRQQLAAVVMEMADQGHSTQGLPTTATDHDAQQALQWNDQGWPWKAYGPTVMTAVRAGVPVLGGNLPRMQMKDVMQQPSWDTHLPTTAWERQRSAIRSGHCDLLPEGQITPMARIQLAKDARMAQTAQAAVQPGKTVVLIAGRGHVLRSVGVPTWLTPGTDHQIAIAQAGDTDRSEVTEADVLVHTPPIPAKDHCAQLRQQWSPPAAPTVQPSR